MGLREGLVEGIISRENGNGNRFDQVMNHRLDERWGGEDRYDLARLLCLAQKDILRRGVLTEIHDMDEFAHVGVYPNGAPDVRLTQRGMDAMRFGGRNDGVGLVTDLQQIHQVIGLTKVVRELGVTNAILATADLPFQLNERAVLRSDGTYELPMLGEVAGILAKDGRIKGVALLDTHSPATSWWLLKNGIVSWDFTETPAMVKEAKELDWLPGGEWLAVDCDDGAKERGYFINDTVPGMVGSIQGDKQKIDGRKTISFDRQDLMRVNGRNCMINEDKVVGGGTLVEAAAQLFEAGAKYVLVLAPFGELISGSLDRLDRLGETGKFKLIISDGHKPVADYATRDYIGMMKMPTRVILMQILNLIKSGIDMRTREGEEIMKGLGVALNPWQTYCR